MYLSRNMYGFLDFTGETQEGPFWKQILEGKKKQTIRKPRKDNRPHVLEDRYVKIYWKVRHKNIDKPIHFVGYAKVVSYERKTLLDMIFDEEIAKADGFKGLDDFREWFYPEWDQLSPLIHELLERLQTHQVEYVITYGRRLGTSTLRNLLKPLLEEYYVIKWDEFIPSEEAKELRTH